MSYPTPLAACLLLASLPAVADETTQRLKPVDFTLAVGVDGGVSDVHCGKTVTEVVCNVVSKAIEGWRFEPGRRNDAPAAMQIKLTLDMELVAQGEQFALRATDSRVDLAPLVRPEGGLKGMSPPRYPPEAQRAGAMGIIELELWQDPGAKTYRVGQDWPTVQPHSSRGMLSKAARDAASRWKIPPHAPEQLSICTFVTFSVAASTSAATPGEPPKIRTPLKGECVPTYAGGFAPPKLLTDVRQATF